MSDIVHWLRHEVHMIFLQGEPNRLHEAAETIEQMREALRLERQSRDSALAFAKNLQNNNERLQKKLETIARFSEEWGAFAEEALQQKDSE